MIERALIWMNEHYPKGFFCCDLSRYAVSEISWVDLISLNCPILIHLTSAELQECITALIDGGASGSTPCTILATRTVSGTLGDIAIKVRTMNVSELDLVVEI
jgi:precorrin-4 methylase